MSNFFAKVRRNGHRDDLVGSCRYRFGNRLFYLRALLLLDGQPLPVALPTVVRSASTRHTPA